jgi:LEA14-like dessication related protein
MQLGCLILGPRRIALIGAIAAVALTIIFYPLIVFTPFDPERVFINLSRVELTSGSEGEQSLNLRVAFNISNTNDITLTTSRIEYELFADGASVGTDGRPPLFPNSPTTVTDTFRLDYSDQRAELFDRVLNSSDQINWRVSGTATVESGTTLLQKTFSDEL